MPLSQVQLLQWHRHLQLLVFLFFPKGATKPQFIATDVGGVSPSSPLTPKEIAENIGAITRSAGGIGAIVKVIDVIIITARICPQCFLL